MGIINKMFRASAIALAIGAGGAASAETINLRLASYLAPEHFGTKLIITP
ncbi:MAG: ABC transporter substrate-binding protein, partial [Rhodobacteraceae bacterium]|nr:ABC transporter substrate-binding protein [Paracoccaceae bacterium]